MTGNPSHLLYHPYTFLSVVRVAELRSKVQWLVEKPLYRTRALPRVEGNDIVSDAHVEVRKDLVMLQ